MNKLVFHSICVSVLLGSLAGNAQVKTSVQLSSKNQQYLNRARQIKVHKPCSRKELKKLKKEVNQKSKQLKQEYYAMELKNQVLKIPGNIPSKERVLRLKNARKLARSKSDSVARKFKKNAKVLILDRTSPYAYDQRLGQIQTFKSQSFDLNAVEPSIENELINPSGLNELGLPDTQDSRLSDFQQPAMGTNGQTLDIKPKFNDSRMQNMSKNLAFKKLANYSQKELPSKKLVKPKQGQEALADIKNFGKVNQKKSLRDEPVSKRIIIGGTLDIFQKNGVHVDFSPILGYRLNKKINSGVEGTFHYQVLSEQNELDLQPTSYRALRIFYEQNMYKTFFFRCEFEQPIQTANGRHRFSDHINIGIGKTFSIGKRLEGRILVLHPLKNKLGSPLIFRTGFTTSPTKWFKKK